MQKTIERIVKFAIQISDAEQIILFGSMANNTNNVHSDLDLLIIADDKFYKNQVVEKIKHYAWNFAVSVDILIYSKQEIEKTIEKPNSFIESVLKSGKIVYEKEKSS